MAAGLTRPDVAMFIALNRDPNDPNTPPIWTSLQSSDLQVFSSTGQMRGREYELAQPLAADPVLVVRDVNEYLNPDNPSSPYAGQVKPYREVAAVCQWPIAPAGAAVNLINTGTWRGSNVDGYDPTFDNYSSGFAAPNWLNRYGGVTATITTTNPQQGTKSTTYTVAGTIASQGVGFGVPVIPGRQYTSSLYVRQSSASTQQIFLEGALAVADAFRRTSVNSPGTPDASFAGGAYGTSGGAGADYQVVPGLATQIAATANAPRVATHGTFHDSEQTITIVAPALATGDVYTEYLVSRWVDASNHYRGMLYFDTDASMYLQIERRLAGATTVLSTLELPFRYAAGDRFRLSFTTSGPALDVHCWQVGRPESIFFRTFTTDSSAALADTGAIGWGSFRSTANTNANLPCAFANYGAYGSVAGTSTTTTGAYVRLSVTYTANQLGQPAAIDGIIEGNPLGKRARGLEIVVRTRGTAVAGTVNVDAIQHEQAASASTFNAAGPVIYPLFRNFAERYPRTWRARGFEGVVAIPCVDALALLNKIFVTNPADQAVVNAQPDYFYLLDGGADSGRFPDSSGTGQPALARYTSKYGPGTDIQPGTTANIVGAPSSTGVQFTQSGSAGSGQAPGTALGMVAPLAVSGAWQFSFSCWASASNLPGIALQALISWSRQAPNGLIVGFWFELDDSGGASTNTIALNVSAPGVSASQSSTAIPAMLDGNPHHYAFSISTDGTTTDLSVWVDGVQFSGTYFVDWPVGTAPANRLTIGLDTAGIVGYGWNGVISRVAMWNRAVTNSEVQAMYSAGAFGLNGEASGARVLRHIQDGPYNGPTRISARSPYATVYTSMGIPSFDGSIDLLTDSLNTMQAEQGMLWVQPDGVIAFEGREDRWLRTLSNYTFGEDGAGGEISYQDGILFDNDPTYVYPVVSWTRNGGATAVGGKPADRQAAMDAYFPRQFDGSNDLETDSIAQDIADWIFYTHRSPKTRAAEVEIDPWGAQSTPYSLWDKVLKLEPGTRVTAVRRVKSANNGAGLTMSLPMFIERVGSPEMTFTMGSERWTVALQLSPIGSAADGQPTAQPWILEDATYGVLDSTTVLGF